jgi:hypothetical protein
MTRSLRVLCVLVVASVVHVGLASGDDADGGSTLHRVRVTAPSFAAEPIVGDLIAVDGDAITVRRSGADKIVVPTQTVTRFEIRRRAGRKLMGLGIGLLGGAAIGALIGQATKESCSPDELFCGLEDLQIPAYGVVGGLIGAGVGVLVAPGEKWETVDHGNVRVSMTPIIGRHGTVGMLMTLRF